MVSAVGCTGNPSIQEIEQEDQELEITLNCIRVSQSFKPSGGPGVLHLPGEPEVTEIVMSTKPTADPRAG